MRGKVVLVPFPFDDLSATKVRPAVCLSDPVGVYRHVILGFVSTRPPVEHLESDLALPASGVSGLRFDSTLRLHRLMTVSSSLISRELGQLSSEELKLVEDKLKRLFGL